MISHLRALLMKNTFSLNFNILSLNCCGVLNRVCRSYPTIWYDLFNSNDIWILTSSNDEILYFYILASFVITCTICIIRLCTLGLYVNLNLKEIWVLSFASFECILTLLFISKMLSNVNYRPHVNPPYFTI